MPRLPSDRSERRALDATAPLLKVDQVSKAYRDGSGETRVLEGVSMELARGETTSLVGVSGSGKSTLVSLLAGLMLPDSGRVVFDGHDLTDLDDSARARVRAQRIGVVLQNGNLIPFLSALENVELAMELGEGDRRTGRASELLVEVGLRERIHHRPGRLSGGEAQRVAIAMALVNEPDILIADEVTGELDSSNAEQVMNVILEAWRERGLTVLLVTHSRELAGQARHRLRLEAGRVLAA